MELLLTCQYCNKKWTKHVYSGGIVDERCSKCGDKNIYVKELSKTVVDTYIGCPPFKEDVTDKDFPYWHKGD